jgi:hypothetical protein
MMGMGWDGKQMRGLGAATCDKARGAELRYHVRLLFKVVSEIKRDKSGAQ